MIRSQCFTDRFGRRWLRLIPEWTTGYRIATIVPFPERAHGPDCGCWKCADSRGEV